MYPIAKYVSFLLITYRIVVAIRESSTSSVPCLFRSYEHPPPHSKPLGKNNGPSINCTIWEAARATTAAPMYFKPMKIEKHRFVDGGLAANNPSWLVLNEIEQIEGSKDAIEFFLSVGTGVAPASLSPKNTKTSVKGQKQLLAPLSSRDSQQIIHIQQASENLLYERWDISDTDNAKIRSVEPKLWKSDYTLQFIKEATEQYLRNPEVEESLQRAALKLVKRRKQRAHTPKWESFVFGVAYTCKSEEVDTCPDRSTAKIFKDRNELIGHMQRIHNWNSPGPDNVGKYEKLLDRCRVDVDRHSGEPLVGRT
jgi:hypothetical protein